MADESFEDNQIDDKQIANLALLGELIGLFGQTIATFSAYLALQAEEREENQLQNMQKQIDFLLDEMSKLKD